MKLAVIVLLLAFTLQAQAPVDASTLNGKVLLGYQGWFDCPPSGRWRSWSRGTPTSETLTIDLYPDLSEFSPSDLCPLPEFTIGAKPAYLFSSQSAPVVMAHFRWMQENGLDGVLLQRFVTNIPGWRAGGDVVLKNVMAAAAKYGRVVAIEYDVTGADEAKFFAQLQEDWRYLVEDLKITSQAAYLRHNGKPVLSIWGMGLAEARNPPAQPETAVGIVRWFRSDAPAPQRVTYMGGVPSRWRTGTNDARPGWDKVWAMMDVIQPWTVGRYRDEASADRWSRDFVTPDLAATTANKQLYMPVVFPGFSWHNLKRESAINQIPRLGGKFLWRQAFNARGAGAGMLKIAMFDEVNEGTAIFKAAATRSQAPEQGEWLTLDVDGLKLPADWYLKVAGAITRVFHSTAANTATLPVIR